MKSIKIIMMFLCSMLVISNFSSIGFAKEPSNRKAEIKKDYKEAVAKASKYSSMGQIQLADASYKRAVKLKKELNKIEKSEADMKSKLAALKELKNKAKIERKVASVKKAKAKARKVSRKVVSEESLSSVVDEMPESAPPSDPAEFAADAGISQ